MTSFPISTQTTLDEPDAGGHTSHILPVPMCIGYASVLLDIHPAGVLNFSLQCLPQSKFRDKPYLTEN